MLAIFTSRGLRIFSRDSQTQPVRRQWVRRRVCLAHHVRLLPATRHPHRSAVNTVTATSTTLYQASGSRSVPPGKIRTIPALKSAIPFKLTYSSGIEGAVDSSRLASISGTAASGRAFRYHFRSQSLKKAFSRSTVCRHLGDVGWHTVFWLPNRPTSCTASLSGTVSSHSTRTKCSALSES